MLVQVPNIHLLVNDIVYLASDDKSFMIGAFFNKGMTIKDGKEILLLQPLGSKSVAEFELDEIKDKLYYNDYRELDDDDNREVDTQDEFWFGAM